MINSGGDTAGVDIRGIAGVLNEVSLARCGLSSCGSICLFVLLIWPGCLVVVCGSTTD